MYLQRASLPFVGLHPRGSVGVRLEWSQLPDNLRVSQVTVFVSLARRFVVCQDRLDSLRLASSLRERSCFNSELLDITLGQTILLTCVATSSASLRRASFRTSCVPTCQIRQVSYWVRLPLPAGHTRPSSTARLGIHPLALLSLHQFGWSLDWRLWVTEII